MKCQTYPKKSDVNLSAVDHQGNTVLHYLVKEAPRGSFDNYRLLVQLVAAGAGLEQRNRAGKTVLDLAIDRGLERLTVAAQYLRNKHTKQFVRLSGPYLQKDYVCKKLRGPYLLKYPIFKTISCSYK